MLDTAMPDELNIVYQLGAVFFTPIFQMTLIEQTFIMYWTLAKMNLNRLTIYGPRGLLRARIDNRAFLSHGSPAHAP